jgi:hypothetical protein
LGGEDWTPPDPAPDAHGLGRAVVEDVRLREVGERAAVVVVRVLETVRAPDDALGRDPVEFPGDGTHEVAASTRGDEARELIRLEVAQELDHRHVPAAPEPPSERRVLGLVEEARGGREVLLHRLAGEGREHPR